MKRYRLLICVTIVLLAAALYFTSTVNRPISTSTTDGYRKFQVKNFPITINLPKTTNVREDDLSNNNEVLFSTYVNDAVLNFHGYLQVWKIDDLKGFLTGAKAKSRFDFQTFNLQQYKVKALDGYQADWTAIMQDERPVAGKEFFLTKPGSGQVLRISIFTAKNQLPNDLAGVAEAIVASVEWK